MDEPQRWSRSRYLALLIVSVLHVAVVTGLVISAKTLVRTSSLAIPIELLILPQNAAPTDKPLPTALDHPKNEAVRPPIAPPESLTAVPLNSASDLTGPPVDWSQEAHDAAMSMAKASPPTDRTIPAPSSNSPFAQVPLHHKGEQIPTADGRWLVFVSDNCYQVSKSITHITNATNTGVAIQTYCTRKSKTPRGDLFEQLPAFKKNHPSN